MDVELTLNVFFTSVVVATHSLLVCLNNFDHITLFTEIIAVEGGKESHVTDGLGEVESKHDWQWTVHLFNFVIQVIFVYFHMIEFKKLIF
jgi:hypothetical protein